MEKQNHVNHTTMGVAFHPFLCGAVNTETTCACACLVNPAAGHLSFPQRAYRLITHQDEGVGLPVGRGDLVRQPGGDGLGGLDAELRHRLSHQVDPVQKPLRRVAVVLQEAVRLGGNGDRRFGFFYGPSTTQLWMTWRPGVY